jgi:cysteine sulfinate desulfinase/cysteine desulfurase-like protein
MTVRVYLDYNASTPIAAQVAEAMRPRTGRLPRARGPA